MLKIITIDGGAATGKSFISEKVASQLSYKFIATGKLYRLLTIYFYFKKIKSSDDIDLILSKIKLSFRKNMFLIEGFTYEEDQLFDSSLLGELSTLSSNFKIRTFCNDFFRSVVTNEAEQTFIIEGRDAGTVIFPEAPLKFFLTVDEQTAAYRRWLQEKEQNPQISLQTVLTSLQKRNQNDINRGISPLQPAEDAISIDTSNLKKEEILQKIIELIAEKYHG